MNTTALAANPLWYATRAGGTIALILLTATVVLGIVVGGKGPTGGECSQPAPLL